MSLIRSTAIAMAVVSSAMLTSTASLAAEFTLTSADIAADAMIKDQFVFKGFGCNGGNLSPALSWTGAPVGTKSFAITAYDPDAPTGSGWWHWVAYDIPVSSTSLAQGAGSADGKAMPQGSQQGRTDFGTPGYGGPCPPVGHGVHHYTFTVFALKTEKLGVPADATAALIGYNLNAQALAKASITAIYERK